VQYIVALSEVLLCANGYAVVGGGKKIPPPNKTANLLLPAHKPTFKKCIYLPVSGLNQITCDNHKVSLPIRHEPAIFKKSVPISCICVIRVLTAAVNLTNLVCYYTVNLNCRQYLSSY